MNFILLNTKKHLQSSSISEKNHPSNQHFKCLIG